ncbi:hypothetical protein KKH65_03515 [bacterium]|nr:hypothetical protein [bacterium]MBU2461929.1 hypothetical protein [bacterium]
MITRRQGENDEGILNSMLKESVTKPTLVTFEGDFVLKPEAMVIGEHGDSMVFLGDIPDQIAERTRRAGSEMIKKKQGAGWAVGLAVADVVKAILRDEKSIFPLTSLISDWNGLSGLCISVPVEVAGEGITSYPKIHLSLKELIHFQNSYNIIKEMLF